jgi:PAS domain S-box-containing protein
MADTDQNSEQSRALLAAIVNSTEDAIISKNLDAVITSWNKAAEKIFGYTAEEAIGQPITLIIPEDRLNEEPEILRRIKNGERVRHYETIRRAKNGTCLHLSLTISPIVDSEGKIIGASKIARDIGPEIKARDQLQQSEEQFRVTLGSIGDAVIATDSQGRITFINAEAERLTGWGRRDAVGAALNDVFKIINEYSRQEVESPVTLVLREGQVVGLANHTVLISKDGTEFPIDDSGAPIRRLNGDLMGVVLVFRDIAERRRAELTALRYAAIVGGSDDAIISKDLTGTITSWNEGAQAIFGYSAHEMVGRSIMTIIPPELRKQEEGILARLKQGEHVYHFETVRMARDGRRIPVSLTVSPIKDSEGHIIGASKIARDISREIQARERLQQSEEQFRVTLGSIGDAVIATDREGRITFINAVAEQLTGWSRQEAVGAALNDVFKIVNEFTRQEVESPVTLVLREGQVVGLANHTLLISKNGAEFPIDDSGAPIRRPDGELLGVVLVFRDVAERRRAELTALRYGAIIGGSDDAIVSKDLTGIITSWNDGAQAIFGYSAQEMVGQSIMTIIPPELRKQEEEILARLRQGERVYHFETIRVAKDGRHIPVSLTISPIKDSEGHIIGASKIARDISVRKQAERLAADLRSQQLTYTQNLERQVGERTLQLEKTIAELEAFSYSLSHDMRAPLRAINSFVEIVLADYGERLGEDGVDLLNKTTSAAQRMDHLIVDLLAFTRVSRAHVEMGPVNVEKLIRGIIAERPDFQPPDADITIASPLAWLTGNDVFLTQCVTNLLSNAVKFVPPDVKPVVRICSERIDGKVRLWFQDNGIGIDALGQRRLFQMFQRMHSEGYPGTGIGLAIVRKAVERMGGEAGVESEAGKGSRFWLQLPAAEHES